MHSKLVWSFLSLVTLGAGGLISGCDSDAKIAKGSVGESCERAADCEDNLKCIDGVCAKSASGSGGSENQGGEGSGATSTGGIAPVPPVLGGEGETCTKRADCEDGLGCFNQRCTKDAGGEGGEGNTPVRAGRVGESCTNSADCGEGLACQPGGVGQGYPVGYSGVCTHTGDNLVPTGKACGAECREAADCCELPITLHATLGAYSCSDLNDLLDGVDCDTATAAAGQRCLARAAYCECGKNTWACEAGACKYTAACSTSAVTVVDGCPTTSRSGRALPGTCTKAKRCDAEPGEGQCAKDDDCIGLVPAGATDMCTDGECTCYQETTCYKKCSEDLDCRVGYVCNDDSLCEAGPECEADVTCQTKYRDARFVCTDEGACKLRCAGNLDCNTGVTSGYLQQVCGAEGFCEPLGCASDSECAIGEGSIRMFCEAPAAVEGSPVVEGAITD